MATIQYGETDPTTIWKACNSIGTTDPENFARVTRRGLSLDLGSSVPVVEMIVSFYRRITQNDISIMPEYAVHIVSREVYNVQRAFEEILEMQYQDPDEARDHLRQVFHSTRTELTPFVPADTRDTARSENEIRSLIDLASTAREETERIRDNAEDVLADVRQLAAEGGVSQYAAVFATAATTHQKQKKWWLVALGGLSILAVIVASWWIGVELQPQSDMGLGLAVQMTAVKLFVFGILSYIIVLTGRGYRAAAHNQIVNEHRRDALKTFQTFVKATSDDATKDTILVQATQSIFSHRPSGFGQQENDAMPPSHMLELTRSVMRDRGGTE